MTATRHQAKCFTVLSALVLWAVAWMLFGCNVASYVPSPGPHGAADAATSPEAATAPKNPYVAEGAVIAASGQPLSDVYVPGDTLWIIAKPETQKPSRASDAENGGLLAIVPNSREPRLQPMPLERTEVEASVQSFVASVAVKQRFGNPYATKIEAVYRFPLPEDAAVDRFVMHVGERRIHGIIKEKEEAQQIYERAKRAGFNAALLQQDRPNVFEQRVANIEAGQPIDIHIRYFHTLRYVDDGFVFHFPMTIAKRFSPAGTRFENPAYTGPDEANNNRVTLRLTADLGVPIQTVESTTHSIRADWQGESVSVTLADSPLGSDRSVVPDRDFVLKIVPRKQATQSGVLTYQGEQTQQTYFAAMVTPPTDLEALPPQPMEWIFLIDCSGSMKGHALQQAKSAVRVVLDQLDENDRVQIVSFSNQTRALQSRSVIADWSGKQAARRFVDQLSAQGGTQMLEGLRTAMQSPADPERQRVICLMTDGQVSNEAAIFAKLRPNLGSARIFSFGIGDAPNRHLLEGVARYGKGAATYVRKDDANGAALMARFFERVRHPAMTDVVLRGPGFSQSLPDLWVGRPVVATGRLQAGSEMMTLEGRVNGRLTNTPIVIQEAKTNPGGQAIAALWARQKIQTLSAEGQGSRPKILDLALGFNLMSPYTGFVAVDATNLTAGDHGVTLKQPLHAPSRQFAGVH